MYFELLKKKGYEKLAKIEIAIIISEFKVTKITERKTEYEDQVSTKSWMLDENDINLMNFTE